MNDRKRIGDLLVDAGVIKRVELERVIASRPELHERRLLSELYLRGTVAERPLAEALARHLGVPVVILTESAIDLDAVRLVPERFVRERMALPVGADAHTITVCTADPDTSNLLEPIAFATGKRVIPVLGLSGVLAQLLNAVFAAANAGKHVYPGGPKAASSPQVVVAAHAPARSEADALARAIIDAVDGSKEARGSQKVGAVRLKRILVERTRHDDPPLVEGTLDTLGDDAFDEVTAEEAPLAPASADSGPPVALVVDDDAAIRMLLRKLLESDQFEVHECETGEAAIAWLRARRPHVVLLDGMLPGVHGFEICAAMKKSETLSTLPVIMISAVYRGWVLAREITEVHGADYFVEKPFDLQYVRTLVADALRRPAPRPPKPSDVAERVESTRRRFERHAAQQLWFAASADVESWLALDPFDGRAWLERGNMCVQAGDWVSAMGAYEAASVYAPELLSAHVGLAVVAEHLGFVRRARSSWLRARPLAPDDETRAKIDAHLA